MYHSNTEISEPVLLKKLANIINARFISNASPLRVDFFTHDLEANSDSNKIAAETLSKIPHETLYSLPEGKLNLYNDGIVLITEDPAFPIKFYCAWKDILFTGKPAIQTKQIWCDSKFRSIRIKGYPLGGYCLFNILLPRYKIVVGSDEHTPDGERAAKNHVKYALKHGFYVYVRDKDNQLYDIVNHEIIETNTKLFWGTKPENKEYLIIYSQEDLFS